MNMIWQEQYGNWLLVPSHPIAVIHFLGGAFVATAPQVTYRPLLEFLASQGYAIIATPFVNTLDHRAIAERVLRNFNLGLEYLLTEQLRKGYLPVYGVGHSMGCKLHLLIGSLAPQERAGNIFMAFNNYPVKRSIPFMEQVSWFGAQFAQLSPQLMQPMAVEFTPSPEETNQLIAQHYSVKRNLLIKFRSDDIDQTRPLAEILQVRFPELTTINLLKGNHLTPLGQDLRWQAGQEFSPIDAIAQYVSQEVSRDFNQLKEAIATWLNPLRRTIP